MMENKDEIEYYANKTKWLPHVGISQRQKIEGSLVESTGQKLNELIKNPKGP